MLSITHAAIAVTATSVIFGIADPFVLGVAAISSQLPDVDTSKSYTGLALFPISRYLEKHFPHRTVTHSFLATGIVAIAFLPIIFWLSWQYWAAVVTGYFFGWFADAFTKSGVAAFYPNNSRLVIPGNPNNRLATGSNAEYWVLAFTIALLIFSCNLITSGGASESFARTFFKDADTASDMFKRYGSNQQVFARVKGIHNITNQSVDEEYKVIAAAAATSIIGKDSKGILYQIGNDPQSQVKPVEVKTRLGDRIIIKSSEVNIADIFVSDWLKTIPKEAYLSGSLIIDDLNDVKIPLETVRFQNIKIFAGQIELSNIKPSQLAKLLPLQYVLQGQIVIKVRSDEK